MFNNQFKAITYKDSKLIHDLKGDALTFIKTKGNYVNFMELNKIKFEQYDEVVEVNLKVFLKNEIQCHNG